MIEFEHNGQIYKFSNATEELVLDRVRHAIAEDADMCKCTKCYYDVCAMVLNNVVTHKYTTSAQGALMSRVPLDTSASAGGIVFVEIIKAINLAKTRPSH